MEIWKDIPDYEGIKYFRSMAEASRFIGKSTGYISEQVIRNRYSNNSYRWEIA